MKRSSMHGWRGRSEMACYGRDDSKIRAGRVARQYLHDACILGAP